MPLIQVERLSLYRAVKLCCRAVRTLLFVIISSLTLFSSAVLAVDIKETEQHQHSLQAVGTHGMAIFSHNNTFYASHMPLLHSIHAHQIVFSFTVEPQYAQSLTSILNSQQLVTLLPEKFDLIKLIDHEIGRFTADVYQGHFERGGEEVLKQIEVKVEKLLLVSNIHEGTNSNYYLMPIKKDQGLLIHKIGQLPSFDQIVLVDISPNVQQSDVNVQLTTIKHISENSMTDKPLMVNQSLGDSVQKLSVNKVLYLETKDFTL